MDGADERIHLKSTYGSQFTVSPDEKWIAFIDLWEVYVAAFPKTGKTIDLGSGTKDFPVKIVSKDAGINLHWSADNKQLHYTLGNQYYTINLDERFDFIANKPDSLFKVPEKGIDVGLEVTVDKPKGIIAFTNARIITMKGDEVIENGTVVVEGNLIKAVGRNVSIPAGAKQIDCSGKTILPGFIDAHAHVRSFPYAASHRKSIGLIMPILLMALPPCMILLPIQKRYLRQSELIKAGLMTGPRIFSTGTILYGADGDFKAVINSIDDARSALRRTKAYGRFLCKKL